MYRAVLIKEWIKTKGFIWTIIAISLLLHVYMFLKLGRSMRFAGMVHLWDVIISRDQFVFRELKWFPAIAGLVLGVAQFVPEIYQKRLKLTLHLPVPRFNIISWQISYGLISLLSIFLVNIFMLVVFMCFYFAKEFIASALYTVAPWYLAGIGAYAFVAWITLEPSWKRRAVNTFVAMPVLNMLLIDAIPSAYMNSMLFIFSSTVAAMFFVYLSVIRFKDGVQDR